MTPERKGQARKSLWIETTPEEQSLSTTTVRLVRACGSKLTSKLHGVQLQLVRLVRACGSKPQLYCQFFNLVQGQARKSLWIETSTQPLNCWHRNGQARKSLWIETEKKGCNLGYNRVRLVRACGSKQYLLQVLRYLNQGSGS